MNHKQPPRPKVIKAFQVFTTVNERGSKGDSVGIFLDENNANLKAVDKGWYGGKGLVEDAYLIQLGSYYYQLTSPNPVIVDHSKFDPDDAKYLEILRTIKSKLTTEEYSLLQTKLIGPIK